MIILDTNVISALMAEVPDAAVMRWLDDQSHVSLWTTSITVFEIRTGLHLMQNGRRREALRMAFDAVLAEDLQQRILDFDSAAATAAAAIAAQRKSQGIIVDMHDTQIAGIATARRGAIATRNVRHFEDLDVPVINPCN